MQSAIPPIVNVDPKNLVIPPYCGPENMQPSLKTIAYTLFWDLGLGDFVLVRPTNSKLYHVWMGKAKSAGVKDE